MLSFIQILIDNYDGSEKEPEAIAHKLVRMANNNGGRDNITVTIIKPF